MEHVVKKFLVPADIYGKLTTETLTALDREMHDILFGNETCDEQKWKLYSQVLQRYLHHINKSQEPVAIDVISTEPEPLAAVSYSDPLAQDDLLCSLETVVPKRLQQRAKTLYILLKQSGIVNWDNRGVTAIDDQIIINSNILELIKNAVISRKNTKPTGWSKFSVAIEHCDIPKGILGDNFKIDAPKESPRKLRHLNYDTNREHLGLKTIWKRSHL